MDYVTFETIPPKNISESLLHLHKSMFCNSTDFLTKLKVQDSFLINVAIHEEKVIGYKIGYEFSKVKFFSWIGGVDNHYRNQGVASNLMREQHNTLKEKGYSIIQTKNKWRNMLILNIKSGFDIIGTYTDEKGEPHFTKKLF